MRRALAVGGLPYFGRRLATLLDGDGWRARYLETRAWEPRAALAALRAAAGADLVYLVGGQTERLSRPDLLRLALSGRSFVMHWAGSDVLHARRVRAAGRATDRLVRGVLHWAGAPWLADELGTLGMRAHWLPHSWVDAPPTVPPLSAPDQAPFTALAYLPADREAFYGGEAVRRLALALPDVRVLVVGTGRLPWTAPNVTALGWVNEMAPVYARCHALVRLPAHDGLAFMVQEALAHGRHAVWRYPFEGVVQVDAPDDAIAAVRALRDRHHRGDLAPNERGAAYVRERFNRRRIRSDLLAGFAQALG
jgi:putative intracellular protease/amidase